ncbi:MAG TPA: hypothetical protein VNJ54_19155 [Plantibacter sp.]|uniref:hypothetical protein n=1 Tax=unclassified Plantibacter TaxID=2624265 RepID=UPI002BA0DEC3|nr:hypothetical protein [Plantibacter sp.]
MSERAGSGTGALLRWGNDAIGLVFATGEGEPVALVGIGSGGEGHDVPVLAPELRQPLVELSGFGHGRFPGSFRYVDTVIGARLRYRAHTVEGGTLRIDQHDEETGLAVTSVFELRDGVSAFRTWTEVTADEGTIVLDAVSTFATGAFLTAAPDVDGFELASAANDWVAESRWTTRPLRELGLARIDRDVQHQPPRSRLHVANRGSWSTAAAPASMLPEQAGNWAYPLSGSGREAMVFALVNGVLGRMYLSGYLNRMTPDEVSIVREAVAAQRAVVADIEASLPFWPLGLPGWEDRWVSLGLRHAGGARISLWRRPGAPSVVVLPLPAYRGRELTVQPFFPADSDGWSWQWDAPTGELTVTVAVQAPTARVLSLTPGPDASSTAKDTPA